VDHETAALAESDCQQEASMLQMSLPCLACHPNQIILLSSSKYQLIVSTKAYSEAITANLLPIKQVQFKALVKRILFASNPF
jgi:hypothetical protein